MRTAGCRAGVWLTLLLAASLAACLPGLRRSRLPTSLSDEEFQAVTTGFSESAGPFPHSENLVSNEGDVARLARMLRPRGGVYIGVGPEQNFSYIVRLRPDIAFIVDIRAENRSLHLLYKALFELSLDRADFVSRLFSRQRPAGLGARTSVEDLFAAYEAAHPDERLYKANGKLIREVLLATHKFPLSPSDLDWIDYAFKAFYTDGPEIRYSRSRLDEPAEPSYRAMMTATDLSGLSRSYLATEEGFQYVKDLHARNLIVPVVGDFAGPTAIRRVAQYTREHQAIVSAFYASNVEVYLNRAKLTAFCANFATLPHDSETWFIASTRMEPFRWKLRSCGRPAR
jgi:hypothetical protein